MDSKIFFKVVALFSFIFGVLIFASLKVNSLGAVIGTNNINNSATIIFASFFILMGTILFLIEMKK